MALAPLKPNLLRPLFVNHNVRLFVTSSNSSSQQQQQQQNVIPTWNDYFKLRKKRRTYEVTSYVPCTIAPAFGTFSYFVQMEVDPFTKILGMDPLMAAVVTTAGAVKYYVELLYEYELMYNIGFWWIFIRPCIWQYFIQVDE